MIACSGTKTFSRIIVCDRERLTCQLSFRPQLIKRMQQQMALGDLPAHGVKVRKLSGHSTIVALCPRPNEVVRKAQKAQFPFGIIGAQNRSCEITL